MRCRRAVERGHTEALMIATHEQVFPSREQSERDTLAGVRILAVGMAIGGVFFAVGGAAFFVLGPQFSGPVAAPGLTVLSAAVGAAAGIVLLAFGMLHAALAAGLFQLRNVARV